MASSQPGTQPNQTGWDKASVIFQGIGGLAIPISIIVLIVQIRQFNAQQQSNSQTTMKQFQQTQDLAQNQQYQATLDMYLSRMSDLLLTDHLRTNSDAQAIAVAQTFTALRNLDGTRKGYIIRFLWDAKLINEPHVLIQVLGANLNDAIFAVNNQQPNLTRVSLISALLYKADLNGVILEEANLSKAFLDNANLSHANLVGANLSGASLKGTNLKGAIYNTKPLTMINPQGSSSITFEPTQWPKGFDPIFAGACDLRC